MEILLSFDFYKAHFLDSFVILPPLYALYTSEFICVYIFNIYPYADHPAICISKVNLSPELQIHRILDG